MRRENRSEGDGVLGLGLSYHVEALKLPNLSLDFYVYTTIQASQRFSYWTDFF